MGLVSTRPATAIVVLVVACLVSAWAGYLVGAQRAFGRLPFYTIGQTIEENSKFAVFAGWSFGEPPFRWSQGKSVSILLRPRRVPDGPLVAELKLNRAAGQQAVAVLLNGAALTTLDVQPGGGEFKISIPDRLLRPFEDNEFRFDISNPQSPGSSDTRALGIAFQTLRLREATGRPGS
jgi:hypothetical protein